MSEKPVSKGPNFQTTYANIGRCNAKAAVLKSALDYVRNGIAPKEPEGSCVKEDSNGNPSIGDLDAATNNCANTLSECIQLLNEIRG